MRLTVFLAVCSFTFVWAHWHKNRHRHEYDDKNTVVSIQIN